MFTNHQDTCSDADFAVAVQLARNAETLLQTLQRVGAERTAVRKDKAEKVASKREEAAQAAKRLEQDLAERDLCLCGADVWAMYGGDQRYGSEARGVKMDRQLKKHAAAFVDDSGESLWSAELLAQVKAAPMYPKDDAESRYAVFARLLDDEESPAQMYQPLDKHMQPALGLEMMTATCALTAMTPSASQRQKWQQQRRPCLCRGCLRLRPTGLTVLPRSHHAIQWSFECPRGCQGCKQQLRQQLECWHVCSSDVAVGLPGQMSGVRKRLTQSSNTHDAVQYVVQSDTPAYMPFHVQARAFCWRFCKHT